MLRNETLATKSLMRREKVCVCVCVCVYTQAHGTGAGAGEERQNHAQRISMLI